MSEALSLIEGKDGIYVPTQAGEGAQETELGLANSVKQFEELIDSDEFWASDSPSSRDLKKLTRFFPVRYKLPNFTRYCYPMLPFTELNDLVVYGSRLYGSRDATGHENKKLTEGGSAVITRYLEEGNLRDRVNLSLTTDLVKDETSDFVRKLRACVKWQTPKWQGKAYLAASHAPVELFMMAFKSHFLLPSFPLASLDPQDALSWTASSGNNVVFEIDLSAFPNFSTISGSKCLLTCYNTYRWAGYKLVPAKIDGEEVAVPLVSLIVEGTYNYSEYGSEGGHPVKKVALDWIRSGDAAWGTPDLSPAKLNEKFKELCENFDKNCNEPMTWLNADFESVHSETLAKTGVELDGKGFFEFVKKQESNERLTI